MTLKIYHDIRDFPSIQQAVVTTGTFDGVHVGHQLLISRLKELAQKINGVTVIFTFDPHPRMVLHPEDHGLQLLTTMEEKTQLLREAGIDHLIIQPFSKKFSRMTALEYVRDFLVAQLHVNTMVIGYNHHFGRNREGSFDQLVEFGEMFDFEVEEISAKMIEQINVSSTKTRQALLEGDVEKAAQFLGHPYFLTGKVINGKRLGRKLGFPTANIEIPSPHKLIPKSGVYSVSVQVNDQTYNGMLNIGTRPTVADSDNCSIEVHLFDFDQDIYGHQLRVDFTSRIRDEIKFNSTEDLKMQLAHDQATIKNMALS